MKEAIAIALMGLILLLTSRATLTSVHFYWNQNQLAAKHCINKARPQLQCNGKCYLKKVLEHQHSEEQTPVKTDQKILPFYGLPVTPIVFTAFKTKSIIPTVPSSLADVPTHYQFDYQNILVPPPKMRLNEKS